MQSASAVAEALGPVAAAAAAASWQQPSLPSQQHVHAAVRRSAEEHGIDALELCEATWADLSSTERPNLQRVLSKAVMEKPYLQWRSGASHRAVQIALSASTVDGRAGAGDWLSAIPLFEALTLPDDVYQFAVRLRLGLPLAVTDAPCRVFNNNSRRQCGCLLTAMADHAPGCAKAARNQCHNSLRDWWLAVVREAGGRALHKQAVTEDSAYR